MPLFRKKSKQIIRDNEQRITGFQSSNIADYLGIFNEAVVMGNLVEAFSTISEIAFPILSIARRITNGSYQLRDSKTDGIIYDNERMNKFLSQPNPLYTFREMLLLLSCYEMVTGSSYLYGDVGFGTLTSRRWKYCDTYSVLPSQHVEAILQPRPKIFTAETISDIINNYRFSNGFEAMSIEPYNVMPLRNPSLTFNRDSLTKGDSRLLSVKYPISNLIASYEARNAIYVKRGALGALISKKMDAGGVVPLTPKEKEEIRKEYYDAHGISSDKSNVMISETPLEFIKMSMSIQELQPFDEHLEDAIQIAGVYEFPADLIPRKDKSTYSNQNNSEIGLYENVVIPKAEMIVQALNNFLGLENDGMYLSVSFDHISVLQPNKKEGAETEKSITETCRTNFFNGIITLNDWIAKIGGERKQDEFYNKYILDMTEEELSRIRIINEITKTQKNGNN